MREGDGRELDSLVPLVYSHLRNLARHFLSGERGGHTLQATALVHEAYLQLADAGIEYQDRGHLFAVLARTMRRILVDHARGHCRDKRGGGAQAVTLLEEAVMVGGEPSPAILDLDEALEDLALQDARKAQIIELLYFGGLTVPETAEAMETSESTIHREARMAKVWMKRRLKGAGANDLRTCPQP
jgi:RNA polymerase sigma-70 factor (ECF subfamily)